MEMVFIKLNELTQQFILEQVKILDLYCKKRRNER